MNIRFHTLAATILVSAAMSGGLLASGPRPPAAAGQPPADPVTGIAYVRGREVRLIQADGTGDRLLWASPSTVPRSPFIQPVRDLAWRPDGSELAFASDHEQAYSWFQDDIYVVRADGSGLRRLTNPPSRGDMGRLPTGTVKVSISNRRLEAGPYMVYAMGADRPESVMLGPGSTEVVTFTNVADLGDTVQPIVAIYGDQRWFVDVAPNVQPGKVADAGKLGISAYSGLTNFGARSPAWRSDASNVAFVLNPSCTVRDVPVSGAIGPTLHPLLDPKAYQSFCIVARGPTAATADRLLLASISEATSYVYQATEGSSTLGRPVLAFNDYNQIFDIEWLPDGSGFIMSRRDSLMDDDVNLYEYDFASRRLRQLTDLHSSEERLGRFSISPDGSHIVYEWSSVSVFGQDRPGDLYVIDRNGSNRRLLVKDGLFPAWSPARR
jgi:hypothetical protein